MLGIDFTSVKLENLFLVALGFLPLKAALNIVNRQEDFQNKGGLQRLSLSYASGLVLVFFFQMFLSIFGLKTFSIDHALLGAISFLASLFLSFTVDLAGLFVAIYLGKFDYLPEKFEWLRKEAEMLSNGEDN